MGKPHLTIFHINVARHGHHLFRTDEVSMPEEQARALKSEIESRFPEHEGFHVTLYGSSGTYYQLV